MRAAVLLALAALSLAADLPLSGTWVGGKPAIAAGSTVVVAIFDRNGTCCGGPAAALAGLVNLRDSLKDRAATVLVAVDSTKDVTADAAKAAATEARLGAIPLLADATRATGTAFGAEADVTMRYVVVRPDGTRVNLVSPAQVRRELAK